jgi:type IV pilus assembly protein PilB
LGKKYNFKLGELLLNADKITQYDLDEGIEKQKRHKKKIGEIFVMMGLLTPEELNLFLILQKALAEVECQNVKIDFSLFKKIETLGLMVKQMESEKNKIISPKDIN